MALQDFTAYTEIDPGGYWSQTSTRNTATALPYTDTSKVYKDFGASYFGDFEHYFEVEHTGGHVGGVIGYWGLTNVPSTYFDMVIANDEGMYFFDQGTTFSFGIRMEDTTSKGDVKTGLTWNTVYYIKVGRTGTSIFWGIYPTSNDRENATNAIHSNTVINCIATPYRYMQVGFPFGGGGAFPADGYVENLNLTPGVVTPETFEGIDTIILSDGTQEEKRQDETLNITDNIEAYFKEVSDVNNKINLAVQTTEDTDNKINTVIRNLSDCLNVVNIADEQISDVTNDIRTHALTTSNVNNDIRVLASFQEPGDAGFQSLGKEYIKVYIDDVEQTDIDVDSITINKVLNGSHSASFELGRAYDSTKPDMDSTILIKYNTWLLYKGYISNITPASSPEAIRINCNDTYWKNNRTNKYFFVGHKPRDNKEKYYNTILNALSTELGWNPGIGNFIPETMNLFGTGESDSISQLIQNSGNFSWYYDETDTKKLWQAGRGNIVELEKQTIGTNLGLYQVLKHQFTDSVDSLINKLRVQMGDRVIRKFNDTGASKEYPAYQYQYIQLSAVPDWDSQYERLAKNSEDDDGYGWDYHPTSQNDLYKDVFKKFNLPFLDEELGSWTDVYPPEVSVLIPYSLWWEASVKEGILTEGFSIDYENGKLTFTEPIYLKKKDDNGEVEDIRAPQVNLRIGKKTYYSNTEEETDDPESDISNPLMFFTTKVGSYSETIIDLLSLTNLSIQQGGSYVDADGETKVIPSWDDTAFAQDLAYLQLSNSAYKKTAGSIEVTLDTLVTYGINLSNRINIDGVTDNSLNIISMSYNMANFTVNIQLEDKHYYNRTVSIPSHGE